MNDKMKLMGGLAVAIAMAGAVLALRRKRFDLHGRVAVVTGGARGLGLAITRALVDEGCKVAICGRDGDVVQRAVLELRGGGAEVWGASCDTSQPEGVQHFVSSVLERYQKIDILINNAGQCYVGPAAELTADDAEHALRNVFWSQYHPTMSVLPHMRRNRFGRIVNITSIGGKLPIPHQAAYVAGKFAATGWSQTLAVELRKDGVEVSTVTPPPLRNGAPLHAHFNGERAKEFDWFARALSSPFTAISPERVAKVVVSLLGGTGAERAVGLTAWLFSRAYGAFPNLVARVLSLVERRMPASGITSSPTPMHLGGEVARHSIDGSIKALAESAAQDELRYLPEGL